MKAQGLSISFVVVAALAILVLVLAVAFVMGWFHSGGQTVSMQKAKSICSGYCNSITTALSDTDCTTGNDTSAQQSCVKDSSGDAWNHYCNTKFTISGTQYNCSDISPCTVQDATGNSIYVNCSV